MPRLIAEVRELRNAIKTGVRQAAYLVEENMRLNNVIKCDRGIMDEEEK